MPKFSVPVLAQKPDNVASAPSSSTHHAGKMTSSYRFGPAQADGKKANAMKAAGDKYAATLMQPSAWRCNTARHVRAAGAVTLHPPASHGMQLQYSVTRAGATSANTLPGS